MIVWGGTGSSTLGDGGRYVPATDTWIATGSGTDVPSPRYDAASAFTGTSMILWGGGPETSTGAVYCACPAGILTYRDADGDGYGEAGVPAPSCDGSIAAGFVVNESDCNDGSASSHPGGTEVCDGRDNDCNGALDDGIAPPASFASASLAKSGPSTAISWAAVPGATAYDVVEGDLAILASSGGDFTASVTGCLANDVVATSADAGAAPAPGSGTWLLVRATNCGGVGTFDEGSASQQGSRDAEIAASGSACP
jgi:hypothetical protein